MKKLNSNEEKLSTEFILKDLDRNKKNEIPGIGSINMLIGFNGNLLDVSLASNNKLVPHANTAREITSNFSLNTSNNTKNNFNEVKLRRKFNKLKVATIDELNEENNIMRSVYNNLGGKQWLEKQCWNNKSNSETRRGVVKDKSGFIIEIDFTRNNLIGLFPEELVDLKYLMILILDRNSIKGELPPHVFLSFSCLEVLSIKDNELSDEIPWMTIPNSTKLKELWLDHNYLSGRLDKSDGYLDELSNLTHLSLNNNQLTGHIPDSIKYLVNLEVLSLSNNQLSGEIPAGLHMLQKLIYLFLNGNLLSGEVPDWIADFPNIIDINLQNNKFIAFSCVGFVPSSLNEFRNHYNGR